MSWGMPDDIEIHLYGQTPVQAIGKFGKHPFYFRARYDSWRFEVYEPGVDLDLHPDWPEPVWMLYRDWIKPGPFDAGYMTHLQALRLIATALRMWEKQRPKEGDAVAVRPVTTSEGTS